MHEKPSSSLPYSLALMLPRFSRYGGVEGFGYRLAAVLAARGHRVDFICARQEAEAPEGVRVLSVGRAGLFKVGKMLWYLVRAEQLRKAGAYDCAVSLGKTWNQDVVRVGGGPLQIFWQLSIQAWPPGPARLVKRISRLLQPANWLTLAVEKRMFGRTPLIIPISDTVCGWLLQAYPHLREAHPGQEVRTIVNCPDVSRFAPPTEEQRRGARKSLGVPEGSYALGVATTNFRLKGVSPLIRSLVHLPEDVSLHVAGGRNAAAYRREARDLGLESRVFFHGKIDDMRRFYHALDMFVLPTFYDTLGNVVLEALGSGVRTLCSDRAGAADFLPPDQILRDPGDPAAIASAVTVLRAKDEPVVLVPKGSGVEELAGLIEEQAARKRRGETC